MYTAVQVMLSFVEFLFESVLAYFEEQQLSQLSV